jgi:hypothetical protein
MPATQVSIVNRSLEQIGVQTQITGFPPVDTSPAAQAAAVLYQPAVEMVLREGDWDFGSKTVVLILLKTAGVPPTDAWDKTQPVPPWRFEYLYPLGQTGQETAIYVRGLRPDPIGFQGGDPYEPGPILFKIAFDDDLDILPPGVTSPAKVILTDLGGALAVITVAPPESAWDSIFQEAVVRTLSSSFAMALAGRPDFSRVKLEESFQIIGIGQTRVG